jgi:hypothetical protein
MLTGFLGLFARFSFRFWRRFSHF